MDEKNVPRSLVKLWEDKPTRFDQAIRLAESDPRDDVPFDQKVKDALEFMRSKTQ